MLPKNLFSLYLFIVVILVKYNCSTFFMTSYRMEKRQIRTIILFQFM